MVVFVVPCAVIIFFFCSFVKRKCGVRSRCSFVKRKCGVRSRCLATNEKNVEMCDLVSDVLESEL